MFLDNSSEDQKAALTRLTQLSDELCGLLLQERDCLVSSKREGLAAVVEGKRRTVSEIERQTSDLGPLPLREQMSSSLVLV